MNIETDIPVLLVADRMLARGSSAYTVRLLDRLPMAGVQPRLVCKSADCIEPARRPQLPLTEYPYLELPIWRHVVMFDLLKQLSAAPPRLVHAQTPASLKVAERIAVALQLPLVLTVHDFLPPKFPARFSPPCGGRLIAVSEPVRGDLMQRLGLSSEDVSVIHSGVEDPPPVVPSLVERSNPVPVVGTAGPLEARKGQAFFLRAAKRVLEQGRDVEFLIAGSGPEERNLRNLAQELGVADHVTFVPYLRQYHDALSAMDLFCLPSLQQGLGTVMLEAMARGKPVIATDVGGVSFIVRHGETGWVVPAGDPERLAAGITQLLNDPDLSRRLASTGRQWVSDHFNIEQMIVRTTQVYRDLLGEPPPLRIRYPDDTHA